MRPQKAHNILDSAFKKGGFYHYSTDTLDGLKHFKTPQVRDALNTLLEKAILDEEIDTPESYYQVQDFDVISNMIYISDRYNCVGRLQFLKEVLEKH